MPPKKQTTVEHILEKEFDMVRQDGYDFLTARKLAGELNCSTQPIYQAYADMNGLKLALIKKSQEVMMAAYNALNFPWEVVKELIVIQNKLWNFWHTKI